MKRTPNPIRALILCAVVATLSGCTRDTNKPEEPDGANLEQQAVYFKATLPVKRATNADYATIGGQPFRFEDTDAICYALNGRLSCIPKVKCGVEASTPVTEPDEVQTR